MSGLLGRRMRKTRRRWSCWLVILSAIVPAGCQGSSGGPRPATASFPGISLAVGAFEDTAILAGVTSQRGEWIASRGGEISIQEQPLSDESLASVDVVMFRAQRMGDLVDSGALQPIANDVVVPEPPPDSQAGDPSQAERERAKAEPEDTYRYMDIVPAFREQVSRYGTDRLGLPCGGSALVLVYRQDAFDSQANRAAAQKAGLSLEPPATWTQLDALARFFQGRDWDGQGGPDYGIALVLGPDAEDLGNATFLARAASLGQHRDHYSFLFDAETMAPRIEAPPFVEALKALVSLKALGPPGMDGFDGARARAAFRTGKVAMLIDRAERAAAWSHGKPVGVARLPGSERVFEPALKAWQPASPPNSPSYLPDGGGWLIGVSARLSGKKLEAALDFAKYLTSPDNSNRIRAERPFPMLPVRSALMGLGLPDPTSAPDVGSREWSEAVQRTLLADRVVPGLRIPLAGGYLADLAEGRAKALAGQRPDQALHGVALAWTERTKSLGTRHQTWHYRRSLNSLATLPHPPERGK
ncbi:MAG: ABC transporter substrate-binding protein [Isosphaeraceae bacterium]